MPTHDDESKASARACVAWSRRPGHRGLGCDVGGFYFIVLGIRVSSWEAYKPFRIGMVAMIAAFWLNDRISAPDRTSWRMLPRWAPWIAAGIAVASVAIAIRFGIFAAGGADSYGYVSQASLWAEGRLVVPDPLAEVESVLGPAVAPLGYLRARTRARSFRPIRLACRWRWRSR